MVTMFDLIGSIKKKTGLGDLFGDGMSVPKSVQDVIKIDAVYSDGIFLTGKGRYSKTFKFTDINYAVSSKEDKEANFLRYSEILNALERLLLFRRTSTFAISSFAVANLFIWCMFSIRV